MPDFAASSSWQLVKDGVVVTKETVRTVLRAMADDDAFLETIMQTQSQLSALDSSTTCRLADSAGAEQHSPAHSEEAEAKVEWVKAATSVKTIPLCHIRSQIGCIL